MKANIHSDSGRRKFIKTSIIGGISLAVIPSNFSCREKALSNTIELNVPTKLFDGKRCWTHARAGIVPGGGEDGNPRVVMTMNNLDLAGNDVFYGVFGLHTNNLAETWTKPSELKKMAPHYEIIDGEERPVAVSDFWPKWHSKTKTLLGTGHTVVYTPDWKVRNPRPRNTSFSIYNPDLDSWSEWRKLQMPDDDKFYNSGAGCVQRYDSEDGTILLPISFRGKGRSSGVTVCK